MPRPRQWRARAAPPDGLLVQCSCCRRVQRAAEQGRWDLVPRLVASPAKLVTHGLCELCAQLYYHL